MGVLSFAVATLAIAQTAMQTDSLRPPSVPLVAHDPYFSIWSPADHATDTDTVHWTGAKHALNGTAWIDGKPFRFLGSGSGATLKQTDLEVTPTRTIYTFVGGGIELQLTFLTPALPHDLDLLSRPVTYVILSSKATDGKTHAVRLELEASAEIAANTPDQQMQHAEVESGGLRFATVGTVEQPVLVHRGDSIRIEWGNLLLALPNESSGNLAIRRRKGAPPNGVSASDLSLVAELDVAKVGAKADERWLMLGYDDEFSIQYFMQNLRPYWRRNGDDAESILAKAAAEFSSIRKRCEAFDAELMDDLRKAGGEKYAQLCALAFRQALAGNKLAADPNGKPLLFPKENTSNGCIATADVVYPMAPQFLLFSPTLARAMLVPLLDYASSPRWKFPFAPHDLGTYPKANGQVYGGGERTEDNQMPVEESANLLILVAALAEIEGSTDLANRYWPVLTKWAEYLKAKGFDPENQLCTDDFLGHLAHNVNLSAKALIGLASYARLAEMRGDIPAARIYGNLSKELASRWIKESDDGLKSRLTFDRPGTWSQKYNLVWDRILGLGLFPDSVREREMAHYRTVIKPFGLPLDNRGTGAKLDWSLWTATLTQNRADFEAIMDPVYRFVDETPQRVGMGDWYDTANGNHLFMHSRPVVGGVFLQMLYDKQVWKKWASRDRLRVSGWAKLPNPPKVTTVIPAGDTQAQTWRYTTQKPGEGWFKPAFNDSAWSTGQSGFGTAMTPGTTVRTAWDSSDIWIRRHFEISADHIRGLQLWIHHDNAADVYINGVLACSLRGWTTSYDVRDISPAARKALKAGSNTIAIHCHQDTGGQYIDAGFVTVEAN